MENKPISSGNTEFLLETQRKQNRSAPSPHFNQLFVKGGGGERRRNGMSYMCNIEYLFLVLPRTIMFLFSSLNPHEIHLRECSRRHLEDFDPSRGGVRMKLSGADTTPTLHTPSRAQT